MYYMSIYGHAYMHGDIILMLIKHTMYYVLLTFIVLDH